MKTPMIIAVDFDGVIAEYKKGYQGRGVFGPIISSARDLLNKLRANDWKIVIFTTRPETADIAAYLQKNDVPFDHINTHPWQPAGCESKKMYAHVYLDDRAVTFDGREDPQTLFQKIVNFVPWEGAFEGEE